jgi:predicted ATPase
MRFLWFEVQGYKNLRAPLRLTDIGRINVLHGDNNIGKSNLLEAIGLFFVLVQIFREDARGGPSLAERFALGAAPVAAPPTGIAARTTGRSLGYFADHGFASDEIFNFDEKLPIELRARLQLGDAYLEVGDPDWLAKPIEIEFSLERRDEEIRVSLTSLAAFDGTDAASGAEDRTRVLERLSPRRRAGALCPRFALLRADRTIVAEPMPTTEATGSREPISRDLGLAIYDAAEAGDPRFARLVKALEAFRDLTGEGQWRAFYDRRADRADLRFEGTTSRVPLKLMGSGVQQIVNLVARLVMTGADIVAVEEPELNLRYAAQLRLRDVLDRIVGADGEPTQLLLTSHSPAFEQEPTFYAISRGAGGPQVTRRPRDQARDFTIPETQMPPAGARAPLSYVTSDGLVEIPEDVRKALHLEHGGGVFFVPEKDDQHYRMLTNAQFWDLFEPRD